MSAAMRSLGVALCVSHAAVNCARFKRQQVEKGTKFIAGVPVLNYNKAFGGGQTSLSEGVAMEENWLVGVKADTKNAEIQRLCGLVHRGCNLMGSPESGGVPFLEFRGTESDLEKMLEQADGVAQVAEPDLNVDFSPGMERVQAAGSLWGLERIGKAKSAQTGQGVYIYVFDTGVRTTHEQFGQRAMTEFDMSSNKPVECNGDLKCAVDGVGHGTHCAATAAGRTYGVAPGAWIRSVKVLSEYGYNPWSWTWAGMDYVATKGSRPAVASMSLGAPIINDGLAQAAVDRLVAAGVSVIVASGNSAVDACRQQPAFVPASITVGSIDAAYAASSFSNYGSCVDIWAPGSDVLSAHHKSDTDTKSMSGTSMACPHVSGGVALLLEENPDLTPAGVTQALKDNTLDNMISGLSYDDSNKFLYVAAGPRPSTPAPAPTRPPTPAPPPAPTCGENAVGPDKDDDCKCKYGMDCYMDGVKSCVFSGTAKYGSKSAKFYNVDCETCACRRR